MNKRIGEGHGENRDPAECHQTQWGPGQWFWHPREPTSAERNRNQHHCSYEKPQRREGKRRNVVRRRLGYDKGASPHDHERDESENS